MNDQAEFLFILLAIIVSTGILWIVCSKAALALENFMEERRRRWETMFPEHQEFFPR